MKKVCSKCGKDLKENELFCSSCGTKYEEPKEEKAEKEEKPATKTTTKTVAVQPVVTTSKGKADLSIAGFICSLVGFLCCCGGLPGIVGLVLSIIGLVNINNGSVPNGKKGLAIAGIIIGSLGLLFSIIAVFLSGTTSLIPRLINEIEYYS